MSNKIWRTSGRKLDYSEKTLIMAILNVTPDSFSDGGRFRTIDLALKQTEKLIAEGADIIDIGGESTRPNSLQISPIDEIGRVVPVIEQIKKRFDIAVSIDTSKSEVAEKAVGAGAEIINDISGLKFDKRIGALAAQYKTGLVLMHLRGEFETMHNQKVVRDVLSDVAEGLQRSIGRALEFGVEAEQICLDIGIGFSKTFRQNLELIAKIDRLREKFVEFPMLIGVSRKSFIGKILDDIPPADRINGSLAANAVAVWQGANIVRVHDVRETVEVLKIVEEIKKEL